MLDDAAAQLVAGRDDWNQEKSDGSPSPAAFNHQCKPYDPIEYSEMKSVRPRQEHHHNVKDAVVERVIEEIEDTFVDRIEEIHHRLL
jgi:hypothetical protein